VARARRGELADGPALGDEAAPLDLLCGGFPCQDLSVAGRRAGFGGKRSSLFFEFARVADALRPRWLLIENVPGLFTACGCAGCRRCRSLLRWHSRRGCPGTGGGAQLSIDGDERPLAGGACPGCRAAARILDRHLGTDFAVVRAALRELGYGVAYRVLDSRFFGVPQRRRRVFIVGARADGDPAAAARRAGEVLAVGEGCPRHRPKGGQAGPDTAGTLEARAPRGSQQDNKYLVGLSGLGNGGADDNDAQAGRLIAATIAGRRGHDEQASYVTADVVAAPLSAGSASKAIPGRRQEDDFNLAIPISGEALRGRGDSVTPSMDAQGVVRLRDPGLAVGDPGDPAYTLAAAGPGAVAYPTLTTDVAQGSGGHPGAEESAAAVHAAGAGVRRLTPVECERLQGLPDGWTDVGGTKDTRRYSALGDAVTATVAEWIGERLAIVDADA
jgi:DNA (cytosine-5)-methyltransferase 1